MFGLGNDKNKENHDRKMAYWSALNHTFGSTDIDYVLKKYMPELSNAILTASEAAETANKNLLTLNDNNNGNHREVMEELTELKQQNIELQKKYDAMLERMDKILAREEGKGR